MLPNKDLDRMDDSDEPDDDDDDDDYVRKDKAKAKAAAIELQPTTAPPQGDSQVPFTPRTQAFHALDRKLPLRAS